MNRKVFQNLYLTRLFFVLFFSLVLLLGISSLLAWMSYVVAVLFVALFLLTILDIFLLFFVASPLSYERKVNDRLNLGDANKVQLCVSNRTSYRIFFQLYEGFPIEMQERSFVLEKKLSPLEDLVFLYDFVPKKRGIATFGDPFFMISSFFNLASRGIHFKAQQIVKVYPSILQLKKYELIVFHKEQQYLGLKRIRRLGNNSEFEQIKEYVQGDDLRTINWKATSRTNVLMTNVYQEQKSQNIFCVLDKSRIMQMESDKLSLIDYSINSILVLSNILIKNGDKVGLITFADKMETTLPANKHKLQMQRVLDSLYNQQTEFKSPNYELLLKNIRKTVKTRSLIIMFSNFETQVALNRALPTLLQINKKHVLVVVIFENEDINELAFSTPQTLKGVYQNIIAEQMLNVKLQLVRSLQQNNIQTIYTSAKNLSIKTINKYLELKAKGSL